MSIYIDVDSQYRNVEQYPNPADFVIQADQMPGWGIQSKTVTMTSRNPALMAKNFLSDISLQSLIIPYDPLLSVMPRLYVEFYTKRDKSLDLLRTIGSIHRESVFSCTFDKYMLDDAGDRQWIIYKCDQHQVYRFNSQSEIIFRVTGRDGNPLTLFIETDPTATDPNLQILATFEITDYIRSGEYDNHLAETYTTT